MITATKTSPRRWFYLLRPADGGNYISSFDKGFSYGPMVVILRSTDLSSIMAALRDKRFITAITNGPTFYLEGSTVDSNSFPVKITVPLEDIDILRSAYVRIVRGTSILRDKDPHNIIPSLVAFMKHTS